MKVPHKEPGKLERFWWGIQMWFDKWWWKYLFSPKDKRYDDTPWSTLIWCRIRNHPAGVFWFNPGETEPDNHCRNCGEDLG